MRFYSGLSQTNFLSLGISLGASGSARNVTYRMKLPNIRVDDDARPLPAVTAKPGSGTFTLRAHHGNRQESHHPRGALT